MNKLILKPALLVLACMATAVYADNLTNGCDIKAAKIQKEIDYAKAHGNTHRVAGLETALTEVKQHCTQDGLVSELKQKVSEKQQKVAEREVDLKKAQVKGDAKKIAKQQKKLAEANQELAEAKQELATYSK